MIIIIMKRGALFKFLRIFLTKAPADITPKQCPRISYQPPDTGSLIEVDTMHFVWVMRMGCGI